MATKRYNTPVDGQIRLMTKVARMYHENGILQSEIASALNLSQAKVSRLLKRAASVGIVRTTVVVSPGLHSEIEEQLEKKFGLREAVVIDAEPGTTTSEAMTIIGGGAATYLETYLGGNERIGISSWSQTLAATVGHMRPTNNNAASQVVQLLGGVNAQDRQNEAQQLLSDFAHQVGAEPISVHAPGVVATREVRDALMQEASITDVTQRWRELTMALVGIGSVEPSVALQDSGNAFSADDRAQLLANGAVGNVCHNYFDAQGTLVTGDLAHRTISIAAEDFLRIPRRIGLAGGPGKHEVIHAALKGNWINVLITDSGTAAYLMEQEPAKV